MFNAYPYLGKGSIPAQVGMNQGHYLTIKLLEDCYFTDRTVTTDNWFSSIGLAKDLKEKGLTTVGTLRKKPNVPQVIYGPKKGAPKQDHRLRPVGTTGFLFHDYVTAISYKPKADKTVALLSTLHHDFEIGAKNKATALLYYNKHKGGVDTFDQLCANHNCGRQTRRWPVCIFLGMLNIACINSHIIFNSRLMREGKKAIGRREFMKQLGSAMIEPRAQQRLDMPGQHTSVKNVIRDAYHYTTLPPPPPGDALEPGKRVRCVICPRGNDRKTSHRCITCGQPVCPIHAHTLCVNCRPT